MKNKINEQAQAIINEIELLNKAGKYPRRGWKYEASAQLEDAKITNSVASLEGIKNAYCTWCRKCNHNLCMDRAPAPCRLLRTYRKRLTVLMELEEAENNSGAVRIITPRSYNKSSLGELSRSIHVEFNRLKKIYNLGEISEVEFSYAKMCITHIKEANFGCLRTLMTSYGYYSRGAQRITSLSGFNTALKNLLKEVF